MLSSHHVVDQIVTELAERRQSTFSRRAAYLALARAIVNEERAPLAASLAFDLERESPASTQPSRAA
jgi:hypothetical protein